MSVSKKTNITVLSLGAGVQSTAMLLMAEHGEIERPVEAIFADTGWEPYYVYDHLEWLRTQTSIPISVVSEGNLRDDYLKGIVKSSIPVYTYNDRGGKAMIRRFCTRNYKIVPVRRRVRELTKIYNAKTVSQQMGISTDERLRVKPANVKYVTHVYPLIDKNMSRGDCLRWLSENGYPEPKRSACIGCPFRSNASWLDIKSDPLLWNDAVNFDESIRQTDYHSEFFLHKDMIPLRLVNFDGSVEERDDAGSFLGECEGMCGL